MYECLCFRNVFKLTSKKVASSTCSCPASVYCLMQVASPGSTCRCWCNACAARHQDSRHRHLAVTCAASEERGDMGCGFDTLSFLGWSSSTTRHTSRGPQHASSPVCRAPPVWPWQRHLGMPLPPTLCVPRRWEACTLDRPRHPHCHDKQASAGTQDDVWSTSALQGAR